MAGYVDAIPTFMTEALVSTVQLVEHPLLYNDLLCNLSYSPMVHVYDVCMQVLIIPGFTASHHSGVCANTFVFLLNIPLFCAPALIVC